MDEIQRQIAAVFTAAGDGKDPEMQSLLERHAESMPFDDDSPNEDSPPAMQPSQQQDDGDLEGEGDAYPTVIHRIAQFLIQFHPSQRPTAHEAVRFLAESNWDLGQANINIYNSRLAMEEPHSPEEADTTPLDPGIDRAPAVKGCPAPSKGIITITFPDGRKTTGKFAGRDTMDWNDAEQIYALNRWRAQFFRRSLGPLQRPRVQFLQEEKEWLIKYIKEFTSGHKNCYGEHHAIDYSLIDFYKCTTLFNRHFAGKTLGDTTEPRPPRSRNAVDAEMRRIPEIIQITGWKFKAGRKKEGKEEEEEDDQEEEGKGKGKEKGMRGEK